MSSIGKKLMSDRREYMKEWRENNRNSQNYKKRKKYFQDIKNGVVNEPYKNWVKRGVKYGFIDRFNDDMEYWEENPNE